MKRAVLYTAILLIVTGCATIGPEASRVALHSQESNLLNDCKKLGPVTAEASAWKYIS